MRWTAALLVLAAAACGRPPADALPVGARFPLAAGAGTAVVWVLRPDDYLTCQTAAGGVRRLQRSYGRALPVRVIGVGAHPEWLRGFLRRQRIDARITTLDERAFRRRFGRRPGAWLYLVRDGKVLDVMAGRGAVYPATRWERQLAALRVAAGGRRSDGAGESSNQLDLRRNP